MGSAAGTAPLSLWPLSSLIILSLFHVSADNMWVLFPPPSPHLNEMADEAVPSSEACLQLLLIKKEKALSL